LGFYKIKTKKEREGELAHFSGFFLVCFLVFLMFFSRFFFFAKQLITFRLCSTHAFCCSA